MNPEEMNEKMYGELKGLFESDWDPGDTIDKKHFMLRSTVLTKIYQNHLDDNTVKVKFWIDTNRKPDRLDFELTSKSSQNDSSKNKTVKFLREHFVGGEQPYLKVSSGKKSKIVHMILPPDFTARVDTFRSLLKYFNRKINEISKGFQDGSFHGAYVGPTDESDSDDSGNSNKEEVSRDGLGLEKRIMKGGKIYANKNEKKLTQNFVRWIKTKSEYSLESLEQRANARDRIDVVLSKKKETIYAELKSVSSYSGMSKRAIRAALGQILDYQFYDGKPKASQLWIVLDSCEITDSEMVFINTLNKKLNNLNLKLIVEDENSSFKILNS